LLKNLVIFLLLSVSSNAQLLSPIWKSALIPGWGQLELENKKKYKIFTLIEVSSLTACFTFYGFSKHLEYKYKSYAAKHANVQTSGKNRNFWVDIGNYINTEAHDEEHLRWRENESLYGEKLWNWDTEKNMKKFEKIRIKSDQLNIQGKFIIGLIVVNHLVSSIDAFYLKKLKEEKSFEFSCYPDLRKSEIKLVVNF
jgi:hypothetical protein